MTDARMAAANTHRRSRAVQSALPRDERMTCSSHGLALGLIKPIASDSSYLIVRQWYSKILNTKIACYTGECKPGAARARPREERTLCEIESFPDATCLRHRRCC